MTKLVILLASVLLSVIGYFVPDAFVGLLIGLAALGSASYDAYKNKLDLYNCLTMILAFQVVFLNLQYL